MVKVSDTKPVKRIAQGSRVALVNRAGKITKVGSICGPTNTTGRFVVLVGNKTEEWSKENSRLLTKPQFNQLTKDLAAINSPALEIPALNKTEVKKAVKKNTPKPKKKAPSPNLQFNNEKPVEDEELGEVEPKDSLIRHKPENYTTHPETTASGRKAYDTADQTADSLRGLGIDAMYEHASSLLIEAGITEMEIGRGKHKAIIGADVESLKARWGHLNNGMQRMNVGNAIRREFA